MTAVAGVENRVEAVRRRRPTFVSWVLRRERALLGVLGIVLLLVAWQLCASLHWVDPFFTSSPLEVFSAGKDYLSSPQAARDLKTSGQEFLFGFVGALVIGVPGGVVIGWFRRIEALVDPLLTFFYASPRIALTPLMIVWFGIGIESKAVIVGLMAIFPIIINVAMGVRTVDRSLVNVGRGFQANSLQMLITIALPAALPSLTAGIRLGIGQALIGVYVAELTGAVAGVGFTMNQAAANFQVSLVFVTLFIIAGFGVVLTLIFRAIEKVFTKWQIS